MKAETEALLQQCRTALLQQSDEHIAALLTQWFEYMKGDLQVALTIQLNCTYPLAQPMEKSVGWGWSPGYHLIQDTYGRQATRRSR